MNYADLLKLVSDRDDVSVQSINQCLLQATNVKRKKNSPAHTCITFATTNFTPDDAFKDSGKIGLVVWIPKQVYREIVERKEKP